MCSNCRPELDADTMRAHREAAERLRQRRELLQRKPPTPPQTYSVLPGWSARPLADYEIDYAGRVWTGLFLTDPAPTDTKEITVNSRTDTIRSRMAELEAELARLESVPDPAAIDRDADGTAVISYERTLQGTTYTYAAIRIPANGKWYVTGAYGRTVYTDAELRELLAGDDVANILRASGWEPLAKVVETDDEPTA